MPSRYWNPEESLRHSNVSSWQLLAGFSTFLLLTWNIVQPCFLSKLHFLITTNCHTLSVSTRGNDNEQLHFPKTHLTDFRLMGMAKTFVFDEHICAAWRFHPREVNMLLAVGRQHQGSFLVAMKYLWSRCWFPALHTLLYKLRVTKKIEVSNSHFYTYLQIPV